MSLRRYLAAATVAGLLGAGLLFVPGVLNPTEAAAEATVIVLRCVPMPAPSHSYQVATVSMTPDVEVVIDAGTEPGEGEDCAVAISRVLGISGMTTNRMTLHAGENALVVTFIR